MLAYKYGTHARCPLDRVLVNRASLTHLLVDLVCWRRGRARLPGARCLDLRAIEDLRDLRHEAGELAGARGSSSSAQRMLSSFSPIRYP
jgi:hypothetical protein